jgi:phage shock protein PspC (stress-responsive transcriptional regulator)
MRRSSTDQMLFGVCSGLAQELKLDVALVRAIFLITALMGFGLPVVIYLVLALVSPKE